MEDTNVVHSQIQEQALQVHCIHSLSQVFRHYFQKFRYERYSLWSLVGGEVDEGVFL